MVKSPILEFGTSLSFFIQCDANIFEDLTFAHFSMKIHEEANQQRKYLFFPLFLDYMMEGEALTNFVITVLSRV